MATRAVWRPRWYAWLLLGLATLALVRVAAPERLEGHWGIITPFLLCVGVLVLRRLWELNPAVIMCAAIVLTIFSGAWRQMGLGGLPIDRLLLVIVLAQFLLRAPGIAHTPRLQIRNVHLLMCVTLMYVLGSAVAAGTLKNEISMLSLFDQLGIAPYLAFLVAPTVFAGERERNMLLVTLVGLGAYLGMTAIFESLGPHALVFPRYIARVDAELAEGHANGPFQNSVAEGIALFGCAVAAMMAFARWHGRNRRLAGAVAASCVFGCFLTLERGVWIAAVVAIVLTALATRAGRRWLVPGALICVLAIGGALALSPALAGKTSQRASDRLSVWDRQNQTAAGLRMVQAKPLFGFGWNRYTTDSLEYFQLSPNYPLAGYSTTQKVLPLHDVYLSYAVELGLVGVLLWLSALLWGVGEAIFDRAQWAEDLRIWKLGLLALAVFFIVVGVFNPDQAPFPTMLLWVWAGVATGSESLALQAQRARSVAQEHNRAAGWSPIPADGLALPG
jgi:O-antigen ligase